MSPSCVHFRSGLRTLYTMTTSCKQKINLGVTVRGDCGVAVEGRIFGVPKFHSWGKCTMPLMNINSDWISNASSGVCIVLVIG